MNPILLIQGPATYWQKLKDIYNNDIIFCSWTNDSLSSNASFKNILLLDPPSNPGYGNSNLHFRGIEKGCQYAKTLGYNYVLKIRSDFLIPKYNKLLKESCNSPLLSFLAYHNWSGGYLIDYIIGGPVDLLIDIFKDDTSSSTDFSERQLFNRVKSMRINKVNYLFPIMDSLDITCYSLKWERDIIESGKIDPSYIYPEYI